MERWFFNLLVLKKELERKYGIKKSTDNLGPIENEDANSKDRVKTISREGDPENSSYRNVDHLFGIWNFFLDDTFLVRDSNGNSYFIDFDLKNLILGIDNKSTFMGELENSLWSFPNSSYMNNRSPNQDDFDVDYMYDTESNDITGCIENYLQSQISIDTSIGSGSSNSYISSLVYEMFSDSDTDMFSDNSNEGGGYSIRTRSKSSDLTLTESSNDLDTPDFDTTDFDTPDFDTTDFDTPDFDTTDLDKIYLDTTDLDTTDLDTTEINTTEINTPDLDTTDLDRPRSFEKYRHLWVQCENCYGSNYKKFFKARMNICEECGYHLKMSGSERIEVSIDPGTWVPMDEDMVSQDPIGFFSEEFFSEEDEDFDKNYIESYQRKTGLTEAVQTGVGQLNGIPVAMAVMDFKFCGGSMGPVVGEKITRLVEYATEKLLPLIIVCASGGARMQEGSLSLMQMAKISSSLLDYQSSKKLFYVTILGSPTTGGVTASFGMLGDIVIAEPNAYIAFAGKRVIEQTLNTIVPEGVQETENLFDKGLFDLIVPRNLLKSVLVELFKLHAFFPLNSNSIE